MLNGQFPFDSFTQENVNLWLQGAYDENTKSQIHRLLKENPKHIIDCFYSHLTFGTGGLRGLMVLVLIVSIFTLYVLLLKGLLTISNKNPQKSVESILFVLGMTRVNALSNLRKKQPRY